MEIRNEEHAVAMLDQWQHLPHRAQKNQIQLAIEQLELNSMYYEQKENGQGVNRCEKCILLLKKHLASLED